MNGDGDRILMNIEKCHYQGAWNQYVSLCCSWQFDMKIKSETNDLDNVSLQKQRQKIAMFRIALDLSTKLSCALYMFIQTYNIYDYFHSVGGYFVNFVTLFVFCWKLLKTRFQWMVIIVIGFGVDLNDVSGVKQGMLQFLAHRKPYGFLFLDMLEIIRLLSCFMVKKVFRVLFSDRISLMNHFQGIDVAHLSQNCRIPWTMKRYVLHPHKRKRKNELILVWKPTAFAIQQHKHRQLLSLHRPGLKIYWMNGAKTKNAITCHNLETPRTTVLTLLYAVILSVCSSFPSSGGNPPAALFAAWEAEIVSRTRRCVFRIQCTHATKWSC